MASDVTEGAAVAVAEIAHGDGDERLLGMGREGGRDHNSLDSTIEDTSSHVSSGQSRSSRGGDDALGYGGHNDATASAMVGDSRGGTMMSELRRRAVNNNSNISSSGGKSPCLRSRPWALAALICVDATPKSHSFLPRRYTRNCARERPHIKDRLLYCSQVHEKLRTLPDKTSYDIMVPMGKVAFMPGKLVHTNELLNF